MSALARQIDSEGRDTLAPFWEMRVRGWMAAPPNFSSLPIAEKYALIATVLSRLAVLEAEHAVLRAESAALRAENAALREKLKLPPKTPDNSSTPPSRGHKTSEDDSRKPKGGAHAGAHRPLHPHPTSRRDVAAIQCQHCRTDVSQALQTPAQSYDRIEILNIRPDVTRVTLFGGTCPCCRKTFKAEAPTGLEPGSPFGKNLRAFALHLRFTQAISLERLA